MKLGLRWVQVTVLHGGAGEGDFFENWSLGGCPSVLRASSVIRSDDLWGGGNELYLHGSHAERSWLASAALCWGCQPRRAGAILVVPELQTLGLSSPVSFYEVGMVHSLIREPQRTVKHRFIFLQIVP